ncbi:MAG TPA: ABC transporter ATP-binding protein [Candidatus Bathyarchaeia archaeon]|nr:ABC transporter ATP-binding protein [Candidatus Bathyarchaeia archaeon]
MVSKKHIQQPAKSWSVVHFIYEMAWPLRWYLAGMAFTQFCWALDMLLRPYLVKWLINAAVENSPDASAQLWYYATVYCVTLAIVIGAFRAWDWLLMRVEIRLRKNIAERLMAYTLGHSHEFYQQHMSGSLTNKVNDVARGVPQLLKISIERFLTVAYTTIIILIAMCYFHPLFALVQGLWIASFVGSSLLVARRSGKLADAASDAHAAATGCITDTFSNMMAVRLFVGSGCEQHMLRDAFTKTAHAERKRDLLLLYMSTFFSYSFLILAAVTLILLIRLFSAGAVTPGDFILIIGINTSLIWILWGFLQDLTTFIKAFGEVSQGLRTLTVAHDMIDVPHAKRLLVTKGRIQFEQVSFGYPGGQQVFDNFSVTIEAGQKVGLVGYSGSGKSTFVNLILRLFDVQKGTVLIDGQNIAQVTQESLRSSIALIPQDPSLFNRTLRENIGYGKMQVSDKELMQAARYAHADVFIEKLPHQYDTIVGERGHALSGGQRQRIAIARAFVKQAPILLLDEATSALDSVTESYIQDSLHHLMNDRTTIAIAHRLSTLMHMDRILVFDKGRLIEDGSHGELLASQGLYRTLWNAQSCGFLPDQKIDG